MKLSRFVIAAILICIAGPSLAQDKTLRIVLGYPPGASSDLLTRLLAERMRPLLGGQTVIVENKAGGGGIVGNETVKAAPPDGSTLLLTPIATMAAFPHSHGANLRYDPFKDFEPVAHLTNFQLSLLLNSDLPAKNVAEYIALVKKDPRLGDYASAAAGSLPHYFGVLFSKAAGIEMTHIPYKGTGPHLS
jgi:tripartite-type tricarboxylate transporter receptor subunit TctC